MSTAFRDIETKLVHCGERAVEGGRLPAGLPERDVRLAS
jgi:hypothetical protein